MAIDEGIGLARSQSPPACIAMRSIAGRLENDQAKRGYP